MDNLGGANFKVTADATSFIKTMDEAEKRAYRSFRAISKGSNDASVAIARAGNASRSSALGFLYLSQAIEDAQYGFSAIVNNIPMIVMAMGGTGGLAGAVSILAVGANIAMNHWESLSNAFRSGAERDAAEQIAVLADRTEKAAKAFEHLREAKTQSEKASGEAFTGGLTNAKGGAGDFQKRLSEALLASGQAPSVSLSFSEQAKLAAGAIAQGLTGGSAREYIKRGIEDKKAEALAQKSAALIQRASEGDAAARSTITAIIKRKPNAFTDEQRMAFKQSSPEAIKKKADEEANKEITKEAIKVQNEAIQDQAKREKRLRIQNLEDQRSEMAERHHQEDLALQKRKEALGHPSQTLSGAKAVSDYYQKAMNDSPLVRLTKEAKDIQERQHQELLKINKTLEKERRGTFPS